MYQQGGIMQVAPRQGYFLGKLVKSVTKGVKKLIKSPVRGYIFDLKPINPGYSAQMTETIVKVVPMGDLNAYLEVPSSDIGFIKKDMDVDISIDSYPSSDFGVIKGKIDTIGKDSIRPEKGVQGSEDVYPVRVKLLSQKLNTGNIDTQYLFC